MPPEPSDLKKLTNAVRLLIGICSLILAVLVLICFRIYRVNLMEVLLYGSLLIGFGLTLGYGFIGLCRFRSSVQQRASRHPASSAES